MTSVKAYAAQGAATPLAPFSIDRREPAADDVEIKILYCGVCHSDIHTARNEWGGTIYPAVPGHEIVGKVTRVGANVTRFKAGDTVGVGCFVDSCMHCANCKNDWSNTAKTAIPKPTTRLARIKKPSRWVATQAILWLHNTLCYRYPTNYRSKK